MLRYSIFEAAINDLKGFISPLYIFITCPTHDMANLACIREYSEQRNAIRDAFGSLTSDMLLFALLHTGSFIPWAGAYSTDVSPVRDRSICLRGKIPAQMRRWVRADRQSLMSPRYVTCISLCVAKNEHARTFVSSVDDDCIHYTSCVNRAIRCVVAVAVGALRSVNIFPHRMLGLTRPLMWLADGGCLAGIIAGGFTDGCSKGGEGRRIGGVERRTIASEDIFFDNG